MEQGLREGGLHRRHPGPRPAGGRRVRSGGYPLQHDPLDHHVGRLRHGPLADQSENRRDPRRRHHLRRGHDPLFPSRVHSHGGHSRGHRAIGRRPAPGVSEALCLRNPHVRRPDSGTRPVVGRQAGIAIGAFQPTWAIAGGYRHGLPVLAMLDGARHATAAWIDRLGDGRQGRPRTRRQDPGEAHRPGRQGSGHARSRPHPGPAPQFQGQHGTIAPGRQQSGGHRPQGQFRLHHGLPAGQHRSQGAEAGRLLLADHRHVRLLGYRVRLQAARRERSQGTGQDRRPPRRKPS